MIPGQGTEIPHATGRGQKRKKRTPKHKLLRKKLIDWDFTLKNTFKKIKRQAMGNSLAVQWLKLGTFTAVVSHRLGESIDKNKNRK